MNDVVVVTHRTPESMRADVAAACGELGLQAIPWRSGEPTPSGAALVVSGLREGQRTIPADVAEAAARAGARAPLLLLADEPLVLPVVTLQGGAVVVVEAPVSRARLLGTLRMLAECRAPAQWSQVLRFEAWVAHAPPASLVEPDSHGEVDTAIVPFNGWTTARTDRVRRALDALARGDDAVVAGALDGRAGLLRLSVRTREWTIFWPRTDRPAWIQSPARIPRILDVAAAAASAPFNILRVKAEHGDVAAVLSHAPPGPTGPVEMEAAMSDGGAALLARLTERDATLGGAVVEVR